MKSETIKRISLWLWVQQCHVGRLKSGMVYCTTEVITCCRSALLPAHRCLHFLQQCTRGFCIVFQFLWSSQRCLLSVWALVSLLIATEDVCSWSTQGLVSWLSQEQESSLADPASRHSGTPTMPSAGPLAGQFPPLASEKGHLVQ